MPGFLNSATGDQFFQELSRIADEYGGVNMSADAIRSNLNLKLQGDLHVEPDHLMIVGMNLGVEYAFNSWVAQQDHDVTVGELIANIDANTDFG